MQDYEVVASRYAQTPVRINRSELTKKLIDHFCVGGYAVESDAHKPAAARVSLARRDSTFLFQFPDPLFSGAGPCGLRANDRRLLHPARRQADIPSPAPRDELFPIPGDSAVAVSCPSHLRIVITQAANAGRGRWRGNCLHPPS